MIQKIVLSVIALTVLINVFTTDVLASGFFLKSIGSVDTGGQQISHWWYTSTNPVFNGEATAGAEVTADIDGKVSKVTADSAGVWSYSATDLAAGDHEVTFTSGGSTIKFTLTLGTENVDWNAVGSGSAETLPTAGTYIPTMLLLIGGLGMGLLGGKIVLNANTK